jgi:hypothetical protein
VYPCAGRTLISVSARQPRVSSVYCASRREVADVFLFYPSISYLFRYFAWATALTFVKYSFSYFFHLESTVLAVTTPAPHCRDRRASFEFSGRRVDVRLVHFRTRVSAERATLARVRQIDQRRRRHRVPRSTDCNGAMSDVRVYRLPFLNAK